MIVLQTMASNAGFRDPAANGQRTACYRQLLATTARHGAAVLLLPGGFWTVDGPGDVGPLADRQVDEAGWAGDLVIGGIDVMGRGAKGIHTKTSGPCRATPYFGFAGGSRDGKPISRRTLATNEQHQRERMGCPGRSSTRSRSHGEHRMFCGLMSRWTSTLSRAFRSAPHICRRK